MASSHYILVVYIVVITVTHGHEAPEILGKSYYPAAGVDLTRPGSSSGYKIFKNISHECMTRTDNLKNDFNFTKYYENSTVYFNEIAAGVGLTSLAGRYTFESTFKRESSGLTAVSFSAMSMSIGKIVAISDLNWKDCNNLELDDELRNKLEQLSNDPPEHPSSYIDFMKTCGVAVLRQIGFGANLNFTSFEQTDGKINKDVFLINMCAGLGDYFVKFCSGVAKGETVTSKSSEIHISVIVSGSSDEARRRLLAMGSDYKDVKEDINKFLEDIRNNAVPLAPKYEPTWDIIKGLYLHDEKMVKAANMMEQIYRGYGDYGCTNVTKNGLLLRSFVKRYERDSVVFYKCVLAHEGCHSDSDCHKTDHGLRCYGKTCVEYRKPNPGKKAYRAVIRREATGNANDRVNKNCYLDEDDKPKCNLDHTHDTVVWDGERGIENPRNFGTVLKPAVTIIVLAALMAVKSANR